MRRFYDAQDARRGRLIDAGLCIDCGGPGRPDRVRCADCGSRENERALTRYHARKKSPPRNAKCGLCGESGHYRQRCPQRRAA